MSVTMSKGIESLLKSKRETHNGPDLIDRWLTSGCEMETQLNVAAGDGEPVAGRRNTFSDGLETWHHVRIPKNAHDVSVFNDYGLRFDLTKHGEAIGSTGWNWQRKSSQWVAFDFDSITGHAVGVGVSNDELARIKAAASALDWVEVRKSTGGNGLHLYVLLDAIPCENHTVHAAMARAILGMMATAAGFDFAANVDTCGGNIWIWHRKMSAANGGLKLIKPASRTLTESDLPPNWRDNIDVVTRRRTKVRVAGVGDEYTDSFDSLASSRKLIALDAKHKAIIQALAESGYSAVWVPDYHLLQTHTKAFATIQTEKRESLALTGFFETNSPGSDPGSPNCFAFPLEKGAWRVYRFSPGAREAETWEQDGTGWTSCYFNQQPGLALACMAMGGVEKPRNGGFAFRRGTDAIRAAEALGQKIELPPVLHDRPTVLKKKH
jgi:hypothetical protein